MKSKILGINAHIPTTALIDKAVECGFKWIRLDFAWNVLEPKKGVYNWSAMDTAVNYAVKKGLMIYGPIAYSPAWLNKDHRECPTNPDEWAYFVAKCASRYMNKINHWGLWNEPNLKQFYVGSKEDYLKVILIKGNQALRSISKNIKIVAGDLATTSSSDWPDWFELLYKNHTLYDIFAWHTYQSNASTIYFRYMLGKIPLISWFIRSYQPFKWYLDKVKQNGKEIWLTETGWKAKNSKEEKKQKDNIEDLQEIQNDIDSSVTFIYEIIDDQNIDDKWGIYKADGSKKQTAEWLTTNN